MLLGTGAKEMFVYLTLNGKFRVKRGKDVDNERKEQREITRNKV